MQNRKIKILFSTFNVQKIGRFLFPILVIIFSVPAKINAKGGEEATKLVVRFGNYLNSWSRNPDDIEARDGLKAICNDGYGMRVADRLALEKCTTTDDNTILLGSYLRIFEDRHNEKIDYIIYNPKVEEVATKYAMDNTNIISVVADVEVKSASLNYMMKNVFYIKDNKICFIGDYAKETAQNERIDISKLNCPLWVSDTIIEADWNYHGFEIVVKSDLEWDVVLYKRSSWRKDERSYSHKCTSWRAVPRWFTGWEMGKCTYNDSILSVYMDLNLRTSKYSDSVIIKSGEYQKKIKITQYGYNLHKATINHYYIENKGGYLIAHVDFDAYNNSTKGDTKFYLKVGVGDGSDSNIFSWENKVEYRMASGKHLHKKDVKMKIPSYYRGEDLVIIIGDSYGNVLARKVISIK